MRKQCARELEKGFDDCIQSCNDWLSSFGDRYWKPAAYALSQNQFRNWENNHLGEDRNRLISAIESWVSMACDAFGHSKPSSLSISFPADPDVYLPSTPRDLDFLDKVVDILSGGEISDTIVHNYQVDVINAYLRASNSYLCNFRNNVVSAVKSYVDRVYANSVFQPTFPERPDEVKFMAIRLEKIREKMRILQTVK